jgi:two-component system chemotaxis response regulator CheB
MSLNANPNLNSSKIRVLVVDDSALMRKLIPQMLEADPSIEVAGTAMDGNFCLKKIEELRPSVVTLDLQMPGMNGIDTLKEIMRRHPVPVIVVSSHSTEGASITLRALGLGAFDFVAKPDSSQMAETARELIAKIKAAAAGKIVRPGSLSPASARLENNSHLRSSSGPTRTVAIGISTGGPQALEFLLPQLPPDFPGSILVVQHMPENFTDMFARRLDELCSLQVKLAHSGDNLQSGRVLICPGNRHMKVKRLPIGDVVVLNDDERVNGHRPSVDVLFHSVAEQFGPLGIGVIMTGMGDDGAQGLGAIKKAGGMTIAQSEESCVVYGMPKVAVERGFAKRIVALDVLPSTLQVLCSRNQIHTEGDTPGRAFHAGR